MRIDELMRLQNFFLSKQCSIFRCNMIQTRLMAVPTFFRTKVNRGGQQICTLTNKCYVRACVIHSRVNVGIARKKTIFARMENHLDNEDGEHDYFTFEVAWEVANKGN